MPLHGVPKMLKQQFLLVLLFARVQVKSVEPNTIKNGENHDHEICQKRIPKTSDEPGDSTDSSRNADNSGNQTTFFKKGANYPCPDGFLLYPSNDKLCYTLTDPQPFPPKCPYPNYIAIQNLGYDFKETIWLIAVKNKTHDDGGYQYTAQHYMYGEAMYFQTTKDYNNTENTCMVIKEHLYIPVNCKEKYRALCAYPYSPAATSKYCQRHHQKSGEYQECIPDSLNIENNRCYCIKQKREKTGGTRNSFCEALAEPLTPFQGYLLARNLQTTHKKCWFGLYMDENQKPRWTIANTTVNYHDWAQNVNYSKPYGAINFGDNPGWILADDDGSIQCAICELQNDYSKNVSLQLKYIPTTNKVELRIKNKYQLSDRFNITYALYCFLGPTVNRFRLHINVIMPIDLDDDPEKDFVSFIDNGYWSYSVYYWCEGFQHPNFNPVYSNTLLAHNINGGYEYAIQMKVTGLTGHYYGYSDATIYRRYFQSNLGINIAHNQRLVKILNYSDQDYYYMYMHVTTYQLVNEQTDYDELEKSLEDLLLINNSHILNITRFGRTDVCLPSITRSGDREFHWRKTFIGAVTLPIEICLQENGEPVMRKCEGNFLDGGFWSDVKGNCSDSTELSGKTLELIELLNGVNITSQELCQSLARITEDSEGVTVVDIYLISEILIKLETFGEEPNADDVVTTVSNVMNFAASELRKAQEMLNSTDRILFSLDNIMTKVDVRKRNNHEIFKSQRLFVQVNNIDATNIIGVALQGNPAEEDFDNFTLTPIYKNQTLEEILEDGIELVAVLTDNLLLEITDDIQPGPPIKLVMTLFYNDILFNENINKTRHPNSRILSILIHDFYYIFNSPISVVFKPLHDTDFEKVCAYWKYGLDDLIQDNVKGRWTEDGVPNIIVSNNNTYATCGFNHLTHFALLVTGSFTKSKIPQGHAKALDVITAIGATLSLVSIGGMFVTALVYKNSRRGCSNKILLNFSVAIALQMILLYVADNIEKHEPWCLVISACLHYTVLSEFCWMLVIAILQYRKFVTVFVKPQSHLLAKACAFSWCLPLLPVLTVTSLSYVTHNNYDNEQGLCYPSGNCLYFGIILPIAIIVLTNLFIFTKIILAVCQKKVQTYGSKQNEIKLKLTLSTFLFFLLGLSWILGLLFSFVGKTFLAYLFAITATFQGFVLFIFFLVINKKLAVLWFAVKRALLCGQQDLGSLLLYIMSILGSSRKNSFPRSTKMLNNNRSEVMDFSTENYL